MPRRNLNAPPRINPPADREKRGKKMFKAFRVIDPDSSSLLAGVIIDAARDGEVPPFRQIRQNHPVYLLDPHLVRSEFLQGFETSVGITRQLEMIHNRTSVFDETIEDAELGMPRLIGSNNKRKKILAVPVRSETLSKERLAIYRELGKIGYRGFRRPANVPAPTPIAVLGILESPITDEEDQKHLLDVVDTAIVVSQVDLSLGALQIHDSPVSGRRLG